LTDFGKQGSGKKNPMFRPELKPGVRIKLSELGMMRCPKLQGRTGTILSFTRTANGFRVQFDGAKFAQSLHRTYIVPIDRDEP